MAWALGSSKYVNSAGKNVEAYLSKQSGDRWKLPEKAETLLKKSYLPELDVSPEFEPSEAA